MINSNLESCKVPVIGQIPTLPDNVILREETCNKLNQLLHLAIEKKRCVVVHGEVGCGKTTLAYLTLFMNNHGLVKKLRNGGIIWLKLSKPLKCYPNIVSKHY